MSQAPQDAKPRTIFLLTCYDSEGAETERLVTAAKPTQAMRHAIGVRRAKPEDVARVLGAGGKVEDAAE